jgi:hypothetical protein
MLRSIVSIATGLLSEIIVLSGDLAHLVETNGDVNHVTPSTKVGALFERAPDSGSGNE